MNLILDTHIILWYFGGDDKLSDELLWLIENPENTIFISHSSLLEISIKISLNKLKLHTDWAHFLYLIERCGWNFLPIDTQDCIQLSTLPHYDGDPFDRIIIVQSLSINIPVISADKQFDLYGNVRYLPDNKKAL